MLKLVTLVNWQLFYQKNTIFKIVINAKIGHIGKLAIILPKNTMFQIAINAKIGHNSKLAIFLPKNSSKLPFH